jgi:hypothetical protein
MRVIGHDLLHTLHVFRGTPVLFGGAVLTLALGISAMAPQLASCGRSCSNPYRTVTRNTRECAAGRVSAPARCRTGRPPAPR